MKKLLIWILIEACILLASHPVMADQLYLSNGDVITGKVIRMEDKKLVFKTDYAGEISVDWQVVKKLTTDKPIKVLLSDGTALEGSTQETDENKMTLEIGKLEQYSIRNNF